MEPFIIFLDPKPTETVDDVILHNMKQADMFNPNYIVYFSLIWFKYNQGATCADLERYFRKHNFKHKLIANPLRDLDNEKIFVYPGHQIGSPKFEVSFVHIRDILRHDNKNLLKLFFADPECIQNNKTMLTNAGFYVSKEQFEPVLKNHLSIINHLINISDNFIQKTRISMKKYFEEHEKKVWFCSAKYIISASSPRQEIVNLISSLAGKNDSCEICEFKDETGKKYCYYYVNGDVAINVATSENTDSITFHIIH